MLLASVTMGVNAQTSFKHTASNPTGAVVNTGSDTSEIQVNGYQAIVGIQAVVTKDSGTIAGTSILYGSVDGENYVALGDTLTLGNSAVNTAVWVKEKHPYLKYRIITTGEGTMAGKTAHKLIARKH